MVALSERSTTHRIFEKRMKQKVPQNYLRRHRKQSGLSQHEVGVLLGYESRWQVSRHERAQSLPPLVIALAYELIFQVPVSVIFVGVHSGALKTLDQKLANFERDLTRGADSQSTQAVAQKLQWLEAR